MGAGDEAFVVIDDDCPFPAAVAVAAAADGTFPVAFAPCAESTLPAGTAADGIFAAGGAAGTFASAFGAGAAAACVAFPLASAPFTE